jgi:hypothetical protein
MENNMINNKKSKYILQTPELYPPLKKKISRFEMDEEKMKEIGEIAQNLKKLNEISIYRILSNKNNDYFINFTNTEKSLQNKYLKKIVDANNEYFPTELTQDKFQKRPISIEDQIKIKMYTMKDKGSKSKKNKKGENEIISRKESTIDILVAPDMAVSKRKAFDEKQNQNGIKVDNVPVEDEEEEVEDEREEDNEEEPSYEDDYRVDSEGDNGVSDKDNYSDGGVF